MFNKSTRSPTFPALEALVDKTRAASIACYKWGPHELTCDRKGSPHVQRRQLRRDKTTARAWSRVASKGGFQTMPSRPDDLA